jgi:hypothetical protein
MGVGGNSDARNNPLNDRRERSAGRQGQRSPEAEAIKEFEGEPTSKPVDGAFGKEGVANRGQVNTLGEGGGGGGGSPNSDLQDVGGGDRGALKPGT